MWKLRYWQTDQPRPTVVEVCSDRDIGASLQHYIDKNGATRVEAVRRGHPAPKPKPKPVTAQKIEWRQGEHPKGELWNGWVGGRLVADVFASSYPDRKPHYTLFLGGGDEEMYVECSSIDSAKRSAQRALNKVVQTLVGGN